MLEVPSFRDPEPSEIGNEYWAFCRRGILACQRCIDCGLLRRYLRRTCANCFSTSYDWVELSGHGTVYACTVCMYPLSDEFIAPYVVALIDLDEGIRVMSNVVDADPSTVAIGTRVRVVFDVVSERIALPLFTPVGAQA